MDFAEAALLGPYAPLAKYVSPSKLHKLETMVKFLRGGKGQVLLDMGQSLISDGSIKSLSNTVGGATMAAGEQVDKVKKGAEKQLKNIFN